jgi:hypothetical protein
VSGLRRQASTGGQFHIGQAWGTSLREPGKTRPVGGRPVSGGDSPMSKEQVAPETRGVAVELLATVDLGPGCRAWKGASFACEW